MMPVSLALGLGVLGAALASFAGVIAERLNTGEAWTKGRSRCNSCARTLTAFDLVPIISWFAARGRCRTCFARVPYRYALSEAVLGGLFFGAGELYGLTPSLALFLISLFLLAIIVLYDLRHTIVPVTVAVLLMLSTAAFAYVEYHTWPIVLLIAAIIGGGFLALHFGSKGRWMGLGDAPVAFALSLLAGPQAFSGLLFSFWIGAAIGICILVGTPKGHRMGIEVPFVPFLAAGYLLALFTQWNPFLL